MKTNFKTITKIKHIFPNVSDKDIDDAINIIKHIEDNIIGRICGNYSDKISQYLSIASYYKTTHNKKFCCLEIGTLFGGSCIIKLFAMKKFNIEGVIYCIDPMTGYYAQRKDPISALPVTSNIFWENLKIFGFSNNNVILLNNKSNDAEISKIISNINFANIMIDGDHTLEGIKYDFSEYSDKILENGYLLIDDYAEQSWPDITSFVNSLEQNKLVQEKFENKTMGKTYILQKKQINKTYSIQNYNKKNITNKLIMNIIDYEIDNYTLLLHLADTYLKIGDITTARNTYNYILSQRTNHPEEHIFLAKVGLGKIQIIDNDDKSLKQTALELKSLTIPEMTRTTINIVKLCEIFVKNKDYENAKYIYKKFIIETQISYLDKFLLIQKIAEIEILENNTLEVINLLKNLINYPAIDYEMKIIPTVTLSNCYIKNEEFEIAKEILNDAILKNKTIDNKNLGTIMYLLGHINNKLKQFPEAIQNYKVALNTLKPQDQLYTHSLLGCGYALMEIFEFKEAQKFIHDALSIKNDAKFDNKYANYLLVECMKKIKNIVD